MPNPTPDTFSAAAGVTFGCGRSAVTAPPPPPTPDGLPLWAVDSVLNKPMIIPNSFSLGGADVYNFSGLYLHPVTGDIYTLAAGGHGTNDNRVARFKTLAANPTWELCVSSNPLLDGSPSPSSAVVYDTPFYSDGKPTSRHNYDCFFYVPQVNRIMQVGYRGAAGNGYAGGDICAFNPDTNEWDHKDTWPKANEFQGGGFDPDRGWIWLNNGQVYEPATKTYSRKPVFPGTPTIQVRHPIIKDTLRDKMVSIIWGGNTTNSTLLNACKWNADGTGTQTAITFNASAGYSQFLADQPVGTIYSTMIYVAEGDFFYWYNGIGANAGHLYIIRPNDGNVWDMELFEWAPGSLALPATQPGGMNGRLRYIPQLGGFTICTAAGTGTTNGGHIYFVRTT